jgi:aspartate 1-decarboxylase
MKIHMFKSKIHRATVTHADVNYEGSITISRELLAAASIFEHEQVHVWNVTRGTRLTTYALAGPPGSGVMCVNGAAAHLASPGDKIIVATFAEMDAEEASQWRPIVVMVDSKNRIVVDRHREIAGPEMPHLFSE